MARDWLPHKRDAQIAMARCWMEVLPAKEAEWRIPDGMVARLAALTQEAERLRERTFGWEGTRGDAARFRDALAEMTAFMRDIHRRVFFIPPLTGADFASLGLHAPDLVRTSHVDVREMVDFVIHLNSIRELVIDFWVQGEAHKAKPAGYDGAVVIWGIRDAPPQSPDDFAHHLMASRTPHTLMFEESDRGKTVWIALAWQNERGHIGEWSQFRSAIIP